MGATKKQNKKNATDYIDQSTNQKKMKSADVSLQTAKNQRRDKEKKMVGWSM